MLASKSIHDVEYRLVEELNSGAWKPSNQKRILIAPTYSESTEGEDALVSWISEVTRIAKDNGWKLDIALHPGAKPRVAKLVKSKTGILPLPESISTTNLRSYSAVITDFSGIAHDALILGIPTVSVLIDFENYQELCPSLVDEDQMNVAYVVNNFAELESQLNLAIESDPAATAREAYVNAIVTVLGSLPGVNTREAVLTALNDDS
jgi:CDP-glycerol glycerophosphotransferase (TagB/SpsB family)